MTFVTIVEFDFADIVPTNNSDFESSVKHALVIQDDTGIFTFTTHHLLQQKDDKQSTEHPKLHPQIAQIEVKQDHAAEYDQCYLPLVARINSYFNAGHVEDTLEERLGFLVHQQGSNLTF